MLVGGSTRGGDMPHTPANTAKAQRARVSPQAPPDASSSSSTPLAWLEAAALLQLPPCVRKSMRTEREAELWSWLAKV
jgi:hypothetical protein